MELNPSGFDYDILLKTFMENIADVVYFKDLQSRFIMVNHAFALKHGLAAPEEVVGKSDFDLFSQEHAAQAYADEQRIIQTGKTFHAFEEKETWPDGRETWASTTKMPLHDDRGNAIGTFGITRDITSRKLAELRARRYAEEICEIKELMEEDVRMAGEMQKNFFSARYPDFPAGCEAQDCAVEFLHAYTLCRAVSGDYCAVTRLSDHEAGIFLCDVSGLGVRAALVTALIRGLMQEIEHLAADPGAYLMRMNELLYPLIRLEAVKLQASACYLVLDAASGRMRLASAGHPVPIRFRHGGAASGLFENLALQGPALAINPRSRYPTIQCRVEPGDAVVLYTDGLTSVKNNLDDPYGERRLLGSAQSFVDEPLADIFEGLQDDALAFARDGRFSDDVCLVGFRFARRLG